MKRQVLIAAFCTMLLLSACSTNKDDPKALSAQNDITASTNEPKPTEGDTELEIEFEYVNYDTNFDWPDTIYQNNVYSFSVPGDWTVVNGDMYGLSNGSFFVPPETDIDNFNFGSHIAVEFFSEPYYDESQISSSSPEQIRTSFFAMLSIEFSKMPGLTQLDFYVWEREENGVYIAEYQRSNDVLVMDTTAYYLLRADCYFIVYATTFGDNTEIPVHEAACQVISTFQLL